MQGTRPHPDFGAEPGVPCGGTGCAHHPAGKQQLSEGCSPCTHTPRGSWCPPASGRLRNNSILTQVPVLWAHLAPFGHRGRPPQMRLLPKCASPSRPLQMRPGAGVSPCCEEPGLEPACTLSTSGSLLPCPGALEHPPGSPTARTEGRAAPQGGTPRGATHPRFLGAGGSTRSQPSSI